MKICPSCNEEYLEHVLICVSCNENLQQPLDNQLTLAKKKDAVSTRLQGETTIFLEGSLAHCREIEKIFNKASVATAVYPAHLSCGDHKNALGASCDMKYVVLINPEDIDKAKKAIEGKFYEDIAKEGQGEMVLSAVDLSAAEVSCPACGETGTLKEGECPHCGLFLGVAEE